jgi:hypothetical protein
MRLITGYMHDSRTQDRIQFIGFLSDFTNMPKLASQTINGIENMDEIGDNRNCKNRST